MKQFFHKHLWLLWVCCTIALISCHHHNGRAAIIVIQPYHDFPIASTAIVFREIKNIIPGTFLRQPIALPATAYNKERSRYRADVILHVLGENTGNDTVVIGLTAHDISTTKGSIADWGVIGLGRCPGNACVVSTFRLSAAKRQSQLYKVALHELGHTQGLPHCPVRTCFMRDAEGGNPTDEETGFCPKCKKYLQERGWLLK